MRQGKKTKEQKKKKRRREKEERDFVTTAKCTKYNMSSATSRQSERKSVFLVFQKSFDFA